MAGGEVDKALLQIGVRIGERLLDAVGGYCAVESVSSARSAIDSLARAQPARHPKECERRRHDGRDERRSNARALGQRARSSATAHDRNRMLALNLNAPNGGLGITLIHGPTIAKNASDPNGLRRQAEHG